MIKKWGDWQLVTDRPMALVTRVGRDQDYDVTLVRLKTAKQQVEVVRHLAQKAWFDARRLAYFLLALVELQEVGLLKEVVKPGDLAREE